MTLKEKGDYIKTIRWKKLLSHADVAKRTGYSTEYIKNAEKGRGANEAYVKIENAILKHKKPG